MEYTITFEANPQLHEEEVLFSGLNDEAFTAKGLEPMKTFGIFIKDIQDTVIGGIKGATYYGCLYIDLLWIDKKLRHQGLGTRLMQRAEEEGKARGCSFSTVNTMDWEALVFYQKLGYEIEFVREGYQKNSKLYLLRKSL